MKERSKMNIVEKSARIIDPKAFEPLMPEQNAVVEGPRKKFYQSTAIQRAAQILTLAAQTTDLKEQLIADEIERWRALGVPDDACDSPDTREMIASKFEPGFETL
jgi:hypothetical protein